MALSLVLGTFLHVCGGCRPGRNRGIPHLLQLWYLSNLLNFKVGVHFLQVSRAPADVLLVLF